MNIKKLDHSVIIEEFKTMEVPLIALKHNCSESAVYAIRRKAIGLVRKPAKPKRRSEDTRTPITKADIKKFLEGRGGTSTILGGNY